MYKMYFMNASLSRLYRPQQFADVVGQEHITKTLKEQLSTGQTAQVYLFTGIRGVGKTTIARLLARAFNCQHLKNGEPCNKCELCQNHIKNQNPDIIEIDAASHTQVEATRENIIEQVKALPMISPKKVFIIDEVHMLSKSSFNALLKTLEEPPAHAVFILCTTDVHKIPETVLSRCQRFPFLPLTPDQIAQRLEFIAGEEGIKLESDIAKSLVRQAQGSIRDAESLLAQILSFSGKKVTWEQARHFLPKSGEQAAVNVLNQFVSGQASEAFLALEEFRSNGGVGQAFLESAVLILRAALLFQMKIEPQGFDNTEKEVIKNLALKSKEQLLFWLKNLITGWQESPKVHPEILAAEMALAECFSASNTQQTTHNKQPFIQNTSAVAPVQASSDSLPERAESDAVISNSDKTDELPATSYQLQASSDLWPQIVAKIRAEHQILGMMLASCKDIDVGKEVLSVSCPFALYIKEFKKPYHQERIALVIKELAGRELSFEASHKQEEMESQAMIGSDIPAGGMVPLFS